MPGPIGTFQYHNTWLPFVEVEEFSSVPRFEQGSYLDTEGSFTVKSVLTPEIPGLLQPGETLADAVRRIKHDLEYPRQALRFDFGDGTLIDHGPADDVANGPFPEVLTASSLVGGHAAIVRFRVRWHARDCPAAQTSGGTGVPPPAAPPYRAYYWREDVTIGDDFRTTRRRAGVIKLATGADGDTLRGLVAPVIPDKFVRTDSTWGVSEDGLSYAFAFTDVEQDELPPPPAVKADGSFVTSTSNGAKVFGVVTVRLTGDPKGNRMALMETAIAIAIKRLEDARPQKSKGKWSVTGSTSEQLYRNVVEVQLRCLLDVTDKPTEQDLGRQWREALGTTLLFSLLFPGAGSLYGGFAGGSLLLDSLKKPGDQPKPGDKPLVPKGIGRFGTGARPLYSDSARPPDPGLFGTAGLRLVSAALQDPCAAAAVNQLQPIPNVGQGAAAPSGDQPRALQGTALRTTAVAAAYPIPDLDQAIQQAQAAAAAAGPQPQALGYTRYDLTSDFHVDPNVSRCVEQVPGDRTLGLPVAERSITLTVDWVAEREGTEPEPPPMDLGDGNSYLVDAHFDGGELDLSADGITPVFKAAGRLVFGFTDPAKVKFGMTLTPRVAELFGKAALPVIYGGPEVIQFGATQTQELRGGPAPAAGDPGMQAFDQWRRAAN